MKTALIPGSFDPITIGHLDIIRRTAEIYDEVIVLVAKNSEKKYLLSDENRLLLVKDSIKSIPNAKADIFDGMLVDYIAAKGKPVLVKGIRNATDFEYEKNMAQVNKILSTKKYGFEVETVFLISKSEYTDISSTLVRNLIDFGIDYSDMVPNAVLLQGIMKNKE